MKAVDVLAAVLVIVGALNWGLVGIARFNLVTALFGQAILASTVFALVGLAGVLPDRPPCRWGKDCLCIRLKTCSYLTPFWSRGPGELS